MSFISERTLSFRQRCYIPLYPATLDDDDMGDKVCQMVMIMTRRLRILMHKLFCRYVFDLLFQLHYQLVMKRAMYAAKIPGGNEEAVQWKVVVTRLCYWLVWDKQCLLNTILYSNEWNSRLNWVLSYCNELHSKGLWWIECNHTKIPKKDAIAKKEVAKEMEWIKAGGVKLYWTVDYQASGKQRTVDRPRRI